MANGNVSTSTVQLPSPDGDVPVYRAEPAAPATKAIVVLQEAFGVNHHIRDITDRFAQEGYLALAPHLFHRSGDPEFGYDDIPAVLPHMQAQTPQSTSNDIDAVVGALEAEGFAPSAIGVVGFCMGGSLTFVTATRLSLGAAVTFYGGGIMSSRMGQPPLIELAPSLQTPWLGLFGEDDAGIPVAEIDQLTAVIAPLEPDTDVITYPGAGHGFHCDARPDYREGPARAAWSRANDWFATHLSA